MKNQLFYMHFFFLIIFCGCRNDSSSLLNIKDKVLPFSYLDTLSYKLIQLETTPESLIGKVNQVMFDSGYIFILDVDKTKSVYVFNSTGKFLWKIGKEGRGPGEYTRNFEMDIDREKKEVIILNVTKLIKFEYTGKLKSEVKLGNYMGSNFCCLKGGKYAFYRGLDSPSGRSLSVTDSSGTTLWQDNPIDNKFEQMPQAIRYLFFSKNINKTAYYIPIWSDKMFLVSESGIKEVFNFRMSECMISTKGEIEDYSLHKTTKKYGYFFECFVNEVNQFFTTISYNRYPVTIIGNLNTGKIIAGKIEYTKDSEKYGFGTYAPIGHDGEYFVAVIDASDPARFPEKYPDIKPTDNPCLFFYKIKI